MDPIQDGTADNIANTTSPVEGTAGNISNPAQNKAILQTGLNVQNAITKATSQSPSPAFQAIFGTNTPQSSAPISPAMQTAPAPALAPTPRPTPALMPIGQPNSGPAPLANIAPAQTAITPVSGGALMSDRTAKKNIKSAHKDVYNFLSYLNGKR